MATRRTERERWERMRAIQDRIVRHPGYQYGTKQARVLGNLVRFTQVEMAVANTAHHGGYTATIDGAYWMQRHIDRQCGTGRRHAARPTF